MVFIALKLYPGCTAVCALFPERQLYCGGLVLEKRSDERSQLLSATEGPIDQPENPFCLLTQLTLILTGYSGRTTVWVLHLS